MNPKTPRRRSKHAGSTNLLRGSAQWRDIKNMLLKLLQVLLPFRTWANLHDWDLWGPLFICLTLAVFVQPAHTSTHAFACAKLCLCVRTDCSA